MAQAVADGVRASEPSPRGEGAKARIIAVNRFFWPDHSATSQILTDLTSFLASRGWEVAVVTSRLRYENGGEPLAPSEVAEGVRIRRVRTSRMGRGRLVGRIVDYVTFYVSAFSALLSEVRQGDVILVTTDPPLFAVVAIPVARLRGARVVTWNHDVFPEVAVALGPTWAAGRLERMLARLRNRAYRRASLNVAISDDMAERLHQAGIDARSLRVVPNWSDAGIHPVAPEDNPLRRDWRLENAFVIGYSGNLGRAHMPEKVADLVRRTRDLPGVRWVFIGGGSGLRRLHALTEEAEESRVQVRPYQKREDLAMSLSVPDLHLVALDPACDGLVVPSKISGICAAGRPVLFFGNPQSALAREILGEGIGVCLDPAAPETWRNTIAAVLSDPAELRRMGLRARASSEARQPRHSLLSWEALLAEAAEPTRIATR